MSAPKKRARKHVKALLIERVPGWPALEALVGPDKDRVLQAAFDAEVEYRPVFVDPEDLKDEITDAEGRPVSIRDTGF